jgi:steroid delta-isomerase-like uncharacterized protein
MSTEENKALVRRFIESYNNRDLGVFDELVSPDYVDHTHQQQGLDNFRNLFRIAFDGFPDWHEDIEDMIAEKDKVWVSVNATGTHTGEWNLFGVSLPPTGNRLSMRMVFIWRIRDGKLSEGWEVDNDTDFLRQLGVIQYTEKAKELFE